MNLIFNKRIIYFLIILSNIAFNILAQTLTDIDGNVYQTVTIGSQVWMSENLKVSHYRNGDSIPEIRDSLDWVAQTKGAWCNNENKTSNGVIYGKLYNGYTVCDQRQIAPVGWHVPTDNEFKILEMFLGMSSFTANLNDYRGNKEANALKTLDTSKYWTLACCPAPGLSINKGNNSSGFSAIGAGYRIYFNAGANYTSFQKPTGNTQFWTSTGQTDTTLWLRHLCVYHEDIYRANWPKTNGSSIRLIKDPSTTSSATISSLHNITVFPNPASHSIYINCSKDKRYKAEFFNILGDLILIEYLVGDSNEIDVSLLSKGVYSIIISNQNELKVLRLVKE